MAAPQAAANPFTALPHALVLNILRRLPADERLLCALVCRAFRAALSDDAAWTHLDFSLESEAENVVDDRLLHAAAAKARGTLQALDVFGCPRISAAALLAVVAANGAALRTLRVGGNRDVNYVSNERACAFLNAAPLLRELHADVDCASVEGALVMLRNTPPYGPLRVAALSVQVQDVEDADNIRDMLDAATAHPGALTELHLLDAPLDGDDDELLVDAVVDCARTRALRCVYFFCCSLSPASVPALVRLLAPGSALLSLEIFNQAHYVGPLLDDDSALALANALRTNNTLTCLELHSIGLWDNLAAAAAAVTFALTGHSSLRTLSFGFDPPPPVHASFVGLALGALVAANTPTLMTLRAHESEFSDDAMRPLFEALPRNTHLRSLECPRHELTGAFARDVLLPAVRANTSLEELEISHYGYRLPDEVLDDFAAAEALVAARTLAA
jgi:hypothetical protein